MKVNFLRTATIAGLLIGLYSSPLLAEDVQKIVHEFKLDKETQESLSTLIKDPEVLSGMSSLVKENLKDLSNFLKQINMTVKEFRQLIKEGGPIADNIIALMNTEQRKNEVLRAESRLKLEETRLKIEQEKQKTERHNADLNYKRDSSYTGICIRGLKAVVSWPIAVTTLGCVGIWKLGIPIVQNGIIPAITKFTKEKN